MSIKMHYIKTSNSRRILVVDDLPDNLFLLQTLLEAEGYEVETADSGRAALSALQNCPANLVLLDMMMPDMNGCEVTQQIRQNQQLSHIPIVLITAFDEVDINEGLSVGANDFIRKPVDFEELLSRIKTFL